MSTTVRCFTHAGMQALHVASFAGQPSNTNQFLLKQPYLHTETLTASTGAAVASTAATLAPSTDQNVKCLYVQVAPGKRVHYEITPGGHDARTATTDSPIMLDGTVMVFGPGWGISVLEAATDA